VPNLLLTDSLNDHFNIIGGYDATPVDGDGMHIDFGAVAVPEPTGAGLIAVAVLGARCARRSRRSAA
jgi:hypothetical protein